jgi:hypothetical protein
MALTTVGVDVELSGLTEIATLLMFAVAIIWIPGVVVIKTAEHLHARRNGRQRTTDRPAGRR